MNKLIQKTKGIIKENLSLNILVLGFLVYVMVMAIIANSYKTVFLVLATGVLYIAGGTLGKIRRFIPIGTSVLAVIVFLVAGVLTVMGRKLGTGYVAFGTVIIFYSIAAYDSTFGMKSLPYALAMFGAECVFCVNGDTRGMVVLVGALLLTVMFTNATYTAMSKYVFSLFLAIVIVKFTGIWHIVKGTRASGLVDDFIKSPVLYVAMVILGIVSLLLRERHPRIKSDRDKKYVPVLKQWQAVIGFSMILLVFWGLTYVDAIFGMELSGVSDSMKMNLVYVATIVLNGESVMTRIMSAYGFLPLMFFTMMMISFVYKAYANFRSNHLFADKLILLMMAGFFVSFAYFDICVPVTLLCGLLSGCVVNGSYAESDKMKTV